MLLLLIYICYYVFKNHIIPKYCVRCPLLDNIKCSLIKVDIMSLPTYAFNEKTIISTIDILCIIATKQGFDYIMVCNQVIMMKNNLFIVEHI